MFSWSTRFAPPTWLATSEVGKEPGWTRYGQTKSEAVQTTFRTRTVKSARLQVSRAHRREATEGDTVRSTINLCRPTPPNDSLRELRRVPIERGLTPGGTEVEGPALVNGAASRPLRIHHHSADGIFFHGALERTVPREPSGLSARVPRGPLRQASGSQAQRPSTLLGPRWDRRVLGFDPLARARRRCLHLVQVPEQLVDFLIGLLSRDTFVGGLGGLLLEGRAPWFTLARARLDRRHRPRDAAAPSKAPREPCGRRDEGTDQTRDDHP